MHAAGEAEQIEGAHAIPARADREADMRATEIWRRLRTVVASVSLILGLFTIACPAQEAVRLVDTLGSSIDQTGVLFWPDIRAYAPIVVVASVLDNRIVKKNAPAARYPDLKLNLHVVKCRLENTLRGKLDPQTFSFYFFSDDDQRNPKYNTGFQASPGSRYIFFLTHENGVLRTIADVGAYSIEVGSGEHDPALTAAFYSDVPDVNTGSLGTSVAQILLTKGKDYDPQRFAETIATSRHHLENLHASRLSEFLLLQRLLTESDPIRFQACRILSGYVEGRYECLETMINDRNVSKENRDWATIRIQQKRQADTGMLGALRSRDPLGAYAELLGRRDITLTDMVEELQILGYATNPEVRQTGCAVLTRYFPTTQCGGEP